ncbi:hypothetical protein GGS20DRAFT_134419 [Poronia punctata]|nr:hypothetical protein GGS20DRAFT_134419 [Poronia punctata]
MKFSLTSAATGLALATLTVSAPLKCRDVNTNTNTNTYPTTPDPPAQILKIAPKSSSCDSSNPDCRTNVQVAPLFSDAFEKYNLRHPGQWAAVLALTAFETDDYQYKHNVFPGRPGQGTSNMQMIDFNIQYVKSIPELADKFAALGAIDTDDKRNQVLALVMDDKYNFGSGPWFLTTKCEQGVAEGLVSGTDEAFKSYMDCVGVDFTDDRKAYWGRAKEAFALGG